MDTELNTETIIKVYIPNQTIDIEKLIIEENLDLCEDDNTLPVNMNMDANESIMINKTDKKTDKQTNAIDNKNISNQINQIYKQPTNEKLSNHSKIVKSILELYKKYGTNILSQHNIKIGFYTEIITQSLLQYSIDCAINTCNSHDIIFYNDSNRNLFIIVAFLSNLGFILLNAKHIEPNTSLLDDISDCCILNPYKLASQYLKNIGMPYIVCHLVEYFLEIKIYNSRRAINSGISEYYDNQLDCVKTLIYSNDLGYNSDNFKSIENIENFDLITMIDKCMQNSKGNCRENEIDLYLNGFIKPKMISVMG